MRRSSAVWGVIGLVLIALAALTRFVVTPYMAQLPSDTDVTVTYTGTATLLNADALQTGDVANAIAKDIPVTIDRRVHVLDTSGSTAVVADEATIQAGPAVLPSTHTYAVDRTSLEAVSGPDGAPAVEQASGLTVAFPVHPAPEDRYTYWDPQSRTSAPITYTGQDTRQGREVRVYTTTVSGTLKDDATLATLPPARPKNLLASLAPALPADVMAAVGPLVPTLPDPVPLAYTADTTLTFYVDNTSGVVLDARLQQQVTAGVSANGSVTDVTPVLAVDATVTPESQQAAADTAASISTALTVLGTVAPIVLLLLGVIALVVAFVRRHPPAQAATPTRETHTGEESVAIDR
ncbi:porin PorA family protein [Rhodococcus sp. LB1]|uniref:porin PorA family protein n=1 Tax=Rhodococcus sp. LB1 TaxID=1807499 RepID=UPI0007C8135C|nr:porin PorA family protein [Rhodococcus sp. LB1]